MATDDGLIYEFPGGAVTKCHKVTRLRTTEMHHLTAPEPRSSKSRCGQGPALKILGENSSLLLSSFWCFLATLDLYWRIDDSLQIFVGHCVSFLLLP